MEDPLTDLFRIGSDGDISAEMKCLLQQKPGSKPIFRISLKPILPRLPSMTLEDYRTVRKDEIPGRVQQSEIGTFGSKADIEINIALHQDLPVLPNLPLVVQRFQPNDDDDLSRKWIDVNRKPVSLDTPPFALANIAETLQRVSKHMDQEYMRWAESAIEPYSTIAQLIKNNKTTEDGGTMLDHLLRLIFTTLYKQGSAFLSGEETLGILTTHGYTRLLNQAFVPRAVTAQFDFLASLLATMDQRLLSQLFTKLLPSDDPKDRLALQVAVYTLEVHVAYILEDARRRANENSAKTMFLEQQVFELIVHSLKVYIAHFYQSERLFGKVVLPNGLEESRSRLLNGAQRDSPGYFFTLFDNFTERLKYATFK